MTQTAATLNAEEAATLAEFARACKAAARAVSLYPADHPAITATVGRIVHVTSPAVLRSALRLTVLPDGLLLGDRAPARSDPAIAELGLLLHGLRIGALTVHPGGDEAAWRRFLLLLGRAADAVRADGGIARLWAAEGGQHVEVHEIDYVEVLRERAAGDSAIWQRVIASCLQGDADIDADLLNELMDIAADSRRLGGLLAAVDRAATATGTQFAGSDLLLRVTRGIVDGVSRHAPDRLEPTLRNLASAMGKPSSAALLDLLHGSGAGARQTHAASGSPADLSAGDTSHAIDIEQVTNDPPDRVDAWLSTISTTAVRALDRTLLLDLLRIESDDERWRTLMMPGFV